MDKDPTKNISTLKRELFRIGAQGRLALMRLGGLGSVWKNSDGGLSGRVYKDYDVYRAHQSLKLDAHREKSIRGHDRRFYAALNERLSQHPNGFAGCRVLCLAARQGTEVRSFIEQGAFAVGIDLNPGHGNRYVMVGDFHDLQFADGTVDVVFTNSLDHAFYLHRILSEANRVLRLDGLLICEVGLGSNPGAQPGRYESLSWANVDDILGQIMTHEFDLLSRSRFDTPWQGDHLVFRKRAAIA